MMTEFFNRMSMWLGTEILAGETPKDRVKTLRFFMRVGAVSLIPLSFLFDNVCQCEFSY